MSEARQQEHHARGEGEHSADQAHSEVVGLRQATDAGPPSAIEAPSGGHQASVERDYAAENLQTQQEIALFTAVMAGTGVVALLLSALGIWLVWRTFTATRRQVQIAQENFDTFYESERAILHAIGGKVGTIPGRDGEYVAVEFANKGRSAARITEVGGNAPAGQEGPNEAPRWVIVPAGGTEHVAAFPVPPKDALLNVNCWARYRSIGPKIHTSHFTVKVRWFDGFGGSDIAIMPHWIVEVTNTSGHPDDT